MASKKKGTKKGVQDQVDAIEDEKGFISKADVARAKGQDPNGPPSVGRLKTGKSQGVRLTIPPPQWKYLDLLVVGEEGSQLIQHKWSKKAMYEILAKHMGVPLPKKAKKDPFEDFMTSLYRHPDGGFGMPSVAFKCSAVAACRYIEGITMSSAWGAFHVMYDLVQVLGTPTARLDPTRVGGKAGPGSGVADMRFRGQFKEWAAPLRIRFLENVISAEEVINLFNYAGACIGVGEWRPDKRGNSGIFRVAAEDEMEEIMDRLEPCDPESIDIMNSGLAVILGELELLEKVVAVA